jgi:hypothetical protein
MYVCIYIYTHVRQATPGYEFISHKVFMKSLRDQICITLRPKVNCVRKVDFWWKGRTPPCGKPQPPP